MSMFCRIQNPAVPMEWKCRDPANAAHAEDYNSKMNRTVVGIRLIALALVLYTENNKHKCKQILVCRSPLYELACLSPYHLYDKLLPYFLSFRNTVWQWRSYSFLPFSFVVQMEY